MKLKDNEIREINNHLEQGKPLPDRYRFLLFKDKSQVELVWNGKTKQTCSVVLPFQTIEQIDEPRIEESQKSQIGFFDPTTGRQIKGWTNKLIWGDNKLVLSALSYGPLRDKIEKQGGIKLIYIDPPFDVGADFSVDIKLNGDSLTKKPSILEEIAYRDTWGKGADSFIAMIYERLLLMRDLLADNGSIYVHCDWRVSSYMKLVLDEVFGKNNFVNEVIWHYKTGGSSESFFARKHEQILFYSKSYRRIFNLQKEKSYTKAKGRKAGVINYGAGQAEFFEDKDGVYNLTYMRDVWDIPYINSQAIERTDYPTQKPEKLLERIIKASSNEGDLIADFFCGSGTTCTVAEKLGRKWIGCDLGRFAIHTTRKRIIGVQRQLKKESKNYRAFEILNLGKYERRHYLRVNHSLTEEEQHAQFSEKYREYIDLILTAYCARPASQSHTFHGIKGVDRFVVVGPLNAPVHRVLVKEVIAECLRQRATKVDILGFEFEMGLIPQILDEAKEKGIHLAMKYIPRDVFDQRAIDKNQVIFYDAAYLEVQPVVKDHTVSIKLTDFSVYYSQDPFEQTVSNLRNGKSQIILNNGKIIRISKDKKGHATQEVLTKKWTDWIDYWSIDFDFENKKEIIRAKDSQTNKVTENWSGDYVFENEWQSFRNKKDKEIELKSPFYKVKPGKRKVAIRAVDILGNDTMKVIEVQV